MPAVNDDNVIDAEITEIGQAITRAETLAQADTFNFDGALQEIGAALVKVRAAERKAEAYAAMKPNLQTIDDAIAFLNDPVRVAGVADEIKRLEDAKTAIDNDRNADKYPDAARKAKSAAKLCPALKAVGSQYETALANRKSWVTDRLPAIKDKPACAPEYDSAKRMDDDIQNLMDDHVYAAVTKLAGDAYWLIEAGQQILADAGLYEFSSRHR